MIVGIHTFSKNSASEYEEIYGKILDFNNIKYEYLHVGQSDFWEKLRKVDVFVSRWLDISDHEQIGHTILPIVESSQSLICFPNYHNFWSYDDKVKQFYLLKEHGFPVIDTQIFWDKTTALAWLNNASFPTVFKLRGGASSSNVVLVKTKRHGRKLIERMFGRGVLSGKLPGAGLVKFEDFSLKKAIRHWGGNLLKTLHGEEVEVRWQLHKNYALFQDFLPHNTFDVRVVVIGEKVMAFRRFNREDDFRASGSGKTDLDPENIDIRCLTIALEVSERLNYQTMGYDFLYDEGNNPLISEMSYTYGYKTLPQCPGYWDKELNFHRGNFWPQYLQLMEALKMPELKQPDIEVSEDSLSKKIGEYIKIR